MSDRDELMVQESSQSKLNDYVYRYRILPGSLFSTSTSRLDNIIDTIQSGKHLGFRKKAQMEGVLSDKRIQFQGI